MVDTVASSPAHGIYEDAFIIAISSSGGEKKKKISLCFWPKTDWQLCCICSMLPNTELNEGCWAQTRFLTLF